MTSRNLGSWPAAAAGAAAWLTAIEILLVAARGGAALGQLPWLAVATFGLTAVAAGVVAAAAWALARVGAIARLARAAVDRPAARRAIGGALLASAAAAQWINATMYVRLYLALHMLLTIAAIGAAVLGVAALGLRAPPLLRGRAGAVTAVLAAALTFAAVTAIARQPGLRFVALERTTALSHGLIAVDGATGWLAAPAIDAGEADDELAARARPAPARDVTGAARGANVLLLTVDSMRADALELELPTVRALMADGVTFARAYAPGCWTVHSMWATLTSRFTSELAFAFVSVSADFRFTAHAMDSELVTNPLHRKKIVPVPHDHQRPNLTRALRDAGYETATTVAYLFYMRPAGLTRDFEHFDHSVYIEHNVQPEGVSSEPLTDQGLFFLQRRDRSKPFFLWIHYMDPHSPYIAHDERARGGSDRERYASELRHVDRQLGRLIDALRADGSLDDTIVILHADHGEEFGEHGGKFHATTVYDETVRVPLVIRSPARARATPGARVDQPVSMLDVMPTVLDLAGVPTDAELRGRSLVPALRGEPMPRRPIVAECYRFGREKRALIDWPHKLITDDSVGTYELYDLAADPRESRNLVDREPATFRALLALLRAL